MRTGVASLYSISLYLMFLTNNVFSRPMKVFSKGFNGKHLPPGGWTPWFNTDHPAGAGDFETYASIVTMYGRTCMGIPCRRPIAIKAVSVYGLRPEEAGNHVQVSARRGISCYSSHQLNGECADYKVRFYCRNLHLKCSRSKFYPHLWNKHQTEVRNSTTNDTADAMQQHIENKMKNLERKVKRKAQNLQDLGFGKDANEVLRLKRRRRRNRKKSPKKRRTPPEIEAQERSGVALLAYHPRHPRFS